MAIALATTNRLKLTLHCQLHGNLPNTDPKHTKVAYIKSLSYPERSKPQRVFQSRLCENGFPKKSGMSKNTPKRVAYIKVCYILKGRNTREYFSPGFINMNLQRSLVQYRVLKPTCYYITAVTAKLPVAFSPK